MHHRGFFPFLTVVSAFVTFLRRSRTGPNSPNEIRMPIAVPSKRSRSYTRQSSRSSTASSSGSGSLAASGSMAGSSSFLVGRERDRVAEMELFRLVTKNRIQPDSIKLFFFTTTLHPNDKFLTMILVNILFSFWLKNEI